MPPRPALCALAAALLAPAAAQAAYAPKLKIELAPATARVAPAITSTITQASGESASKVVRVSFPKGFNPPSEAVKLDTCTPEQESSRTCPEGSRMGTASATAVVGLVTTDLAGTVNYGGSAGGRTKLIVFLTSPILGDQPPIEGFVEVRPDFGFDTVFPNNPDVLTTKFVLALDGAPRSLITNPTACGDYEFLAKFTSHKDEQAESRAKVTISGCPSVVPRITGIELTRRTLRRGQAATLAFDLTKPAAVRVTVKRVANRRRVADLRLAGKKGTNRVRGIGRGLAPGLYRIDIRATDADGVAARPRRTTFRVRA